MCYDVEWVYHRNQWNYELSGKSKYDIFIQLFAIEEWKRNLKKLSSRRLKSSRFFTHM